MGRRISNRTTKITPRGTVKIAAEVPEIVFNHIYKRLTLYGITQTDYLNQILREELPDAYEEADKAHSIARKRPHNREEP